MAKLPQGINQSESRIDLMMILSPSLFRDLQKLYKPNLLRSLNTSIEIPPIETNENLTMGIVKNLNQGMKTKDFKIKLLVNWSIRRNRSSLTQFCKTKRTELNLEVSEEVNSRTRLSLVLLLPTSRTFRTGRMKHKIRSNTTKRRVKTRMIRQRSSTTTKTS